ncbi:DNA-binding protein [Pseudomonadota bacterium]
MKEWFAGIELAEIEGMPNSRQAIAVKAKRNKWLSRRVASRSNAFEYHISNFHEDIQKSLIVKNGTDYEIKNIDHHSVKTKCS